MTEIGSDLICGQRALTSRAMRVRTFLALIGACFALISCSSDGTTLRAPTSDQTTTSRPPPVTAAADSLESPNGVRLSSPDFEPGDTIPVTATCNGSGTVPTLEWDGLSPGDGQELALSFTDQTDIDQPVLLWLATGISVDESSIEAGELPPGAVETLNDYGNSGFGSPCIESPADSSRRLQFRLHVLSGPSGVSEDDPGNEAFGTVQALTIDAAAVLVTVDSTSPLNDGTN